ncbi:MAG: ribosome silencing factor [Actinomycetota bacterium]
MTGTGQGGNPVIEAEQLAQLAAGAIHDKKGLDVELLDVGDLLVITDVFVIATGTSNIHVRSLAEGVEETLADEAERKPLRREGMEQGEWILLDYGDLVVHLFQPEQREYYGLERLWLDAPRIPDIHPISTDA